MVAKKDAEGIACQSCGSSNRGDANFCISCGNRLPEPETSDEVFIAVGQNRKVTLNGDRITVSRKNGKVDREFSVSYPLFVKYKQAGKFWPGELIFHGPGWDSHPLVRFDQKQQVMFDELNRRIDDLRGYEPVVIPASSPEPLAIPEPEPVVMSEPEPVANRELESIAVAEIEEGAPAVLFVNSEQLAHPLGQFRIALDLYYDSLLEASPYLSEVVGEEALEGLVDEVGEWRDSIVEHIELTSNAGESDSVEEHPQDEEPNTGDEVLEFWKTMLLASWPLIVYYLRQKQKSGESLTVMDIAAKIGIPSVVVPLLMPLLQEKLEEFLGENNGFNLFR